MDFKTKVSNTLHDILYRANGNGKNNYVYAANTLLSMVDFMCEDIDLICAFAKVIEKNTTYDHMLSDKDFTTIFMYFVTIVKKHRELKSKKFFGDHSSVGEKLLEGISEIEETVSCIDECVKEDYFTFSEALKAYDITEEEYLNFQINGK